MNKYYHDFFHLLDKKQNVSKQFYLWNPKVFIIIITDWCNRIHYKIIFEDLFGVTCTVINCSDDVENTFLKIAKICLFPTGFIYRCSTSLLYLKLIFTIRIYMTPSYLYPNSFKITETKLILNKSIPGSQRQALVLFFVVTCSLNTEFVWIDYVMFTPLHRYEGKRWIRRK